MTMRIHKPQFSDDEGEIRISARVDIDAPNLDVPDTLWFAFPQSYRDHVSDRADAFLVGLLPSAMALGEDIVVEAPVSPYLARGLREYQRVQSSWWPGVLREVNVDAELFAQTGRAPGEGVGCAFSGGVDSFYTLWQHLRENEPLVDCRLTHCLIINGYDFDVDLENTGRFRQTFETFEPMLRDIGIELLTSRTNLKQFRLACRRRSRLVSTLEAPISASILTLGNLFSRFFIPAAYAYRADSMHLGGGHPLTVPLLSTERTQIMADGCEASRVDKTEVIAEWPETYSRLRVCWRPPVFNEQTGLVENCGHCEKCRRTMITLDTIGMLSRYQTFPTPLRRSDVRHTSHVGSSALSFYRDNLELARRMDRSDRVFDLRWARWRSRLKAAVTDRIFGRLRRGR